ncbi:MAG TPA: hypothetical protein PLS80_05070 [Cyclobacteriaceae bacterium]|nr:hypothetical protein [Cyclobacteriaceae bacterium]
MRLIRILAISLTLLAFAGPVAAQVQDGYEYQTEFIWGINKNTSGGLIGGFVFKKSFKMSDRQLQTFGLEIMNVRHPQEVRFNSAYGNFFTFGKKNYLYTFRLQYGRDFILFKKAPQQGVEIKAVFAAGPSIGVEAPYYVEYLEGDITFRKQYNANMAKENILGPGRLFQGVGESKIVPGLNVKAALNFELGIFKSQVTGFEAGVLVDSYTRKIDMMARAKNYSVYPTLFLTLFFGNRK